MGASEGVRIVTGSARAHRAFVADLSDRVFSRFGDYGSILPGWIGLAGVTTIVALEGETPVGFAIHAPKDPRGGITDLLAIAVEPGRQRGGIGAALLRKVERATLEAYPRVARPAVEATVAEDNAPALRLFTGAGYVFVAGERGVYPRGQRARTLRRRLSR